MIKKSSVYAIFHKIIYELHIHYYFLKNITLISLSFLFYCLMNIIFFRFGLAFAPIYNQLQNNGIRNNLMMLSSFWQFGILYLQIGFVIIFMTNYCYQRLQRKLLNGTLQLTQYQFIFGFTPGHQFQVKLIIDTKIKTQVIIHVKNLVFYLMFKFDGPNLFVSQID